MVVLWRFLQLEEKNFCVISRVLRPLLKAEGVPMDWWLCACASGQSRFPLLRRR